MNSWVLGVWGAVGGLMVEAVQFASAIRRFGKPPYCIEGEPGPLPLLVSVLIRVGTGFGLTWAVAISGRVSAPLTAIWVGAAAPLILEEMINRIPILLERGERPNGDRTNGE